MIKIRKGNKIEIQYNRFLNEIDMYITTFDFYKINEDTMRLDIALDKEQTYKLIAKLAQYIELLNRS
jgi:hypothetical protein